MATKKTGSAVIASEPNNDWMAEEDVRTLARAEEIKRSPSRWARAKAMAKKKLAEMKAVANPTK